MADNYLITGYWGEPHVTVENDRGFNAAVFGTGKFVLPVGEMFRAEYIGNNTVRVYDGKLLDNGAVAGIPAGEYLEFMIPEAGQGMKRNDLIIFEYSRNDSTLVESGVFKVLSGAEVSEAAVDPVLTESDLLSNIASFDQLALWRVPVSGATISNPVQMFELSKNIKNAGHNVVKATSSDGMLYYANVPGVTELYTGLEFTIIPDATSATTLPTLNINDLGSVSIKRRITSNTTTTVQSEDNNFMQKDQPIRVFYNGKVWVADMARANANDIYGTVPIEKGGTGADNAEEACRKLGAIHKGQKGVESGVVPLNSSKKIDETYLPDSLLLATKSPVVTETGGLLTEDTHTIVRVGRICFVQGYGVFSATGSEKHCEICHKSFFEPYLHDGRIVCTGASAEFIKDSMVQPMLTSVEYKSGTVPLIRLNFNLTDLANLTGTYYVKYSFAYLTA